CFPVSIGMEQETNMKQTFYLLAAGLLCQPALLAQVLPRASAFQQADTLAAGRGGRGGVARTSFSAPRPSVGKPFSPPATTQTAQTYLDGTHVSQTTMIVQYRDAEGRVRTETSGTGVSSPGPVQSIVIRDTVAGVTYRLDPVKRTVVKLAIVSVPAGTMR